MTQPTQTERMAAEMGHGQWVPNERFIEMHIPDYRRRMCDLKEQYPGRYERRMRTRPAVAGHKPYTMADWRDTWRTQDFAQTINEQLDVLHERHVVDNTPAPAQLSVAYRGANLYFTPDDLEHLDRDTMVGWLHESYIDPWRGAGVRP